MSVEKHDMNMFLVHGKNGLFINSCVPQKSGEAKGDLGAQCDESGRSDVVNSFSCGSVWSLNRLARHYARSPNNNVAIVDDRLGLSIVHVRSNSNSEFAFDTLRGVGKFRNLYTPIGCKNIKHLQWSNNGVYLVIYFNLSNYSKETGVSLDDNLHIWDISQKSIVGTFSTRRLSPEQWPIIKWVGNSDRFAFCYAQQVSIYSIASPEGTSLKNTRLLLSIPIPRVFSVEVVAGGCAAAHGGLNGSTNGLTNGFANGLANGGTNGTTTNGGGANGLPNGGTNGFTVNGGTNGGFNGTTNGVTNGFANGAPNGALNGLTNGLSNGTTNGMTNGTTNGTTNGATNGTTNGITNGTTNGTFAGAVNGDSGAAPGFGETNGEQRTSRGAAPLEHDAWISLAAYTKADISNQVSGNLRIATIKCVDNELVETSCHNHELKSEDFADMFWSPSGKYLLVLGQSTVDLAGEKYGSTSNCLLFRANGSFVCQVNAQTTHDARWCPTRDEFILMEGNMPCDITLYDANCVRLFEFPKLYRNTIKWNPMGNMVALCGFGNLAGEICFWYRREPCEYEQIVHLKEPCTVISEWSYDSRYFMTASTFPRMKVDNFLKIFNHEGDLLENQKLEECYGVCWMGLSGAERDFVRPRVRKSAQRKAIYRPKILPKDEAAKKAVENGVVKPAAAPAAAVPAKPAKGPAAAVPAKAPAGDAAPAEGGSDSASWHSLLSSRPPPKNTIPLTNSRVARESHYGGSLFSSDHGDKNDPSVDLLDAFKHVFALSQMRAQAKGVPFEGQGLPRAPRPTDDAAQGNSVSLGSEKKATHTGRVGGNLTNVQEDAAKSLSMLMRIKNQLQCEKSKPLQQSILDEVQLLKLLLEAKNRSINRTRLD